MRHAALALLLLAACQRGDSYHSPPERPTITERHADNITRAAVLRPDELPGYKRTAVRTGAVTDIDPSECFRNPTPYVATRDVDYVRGPVSITSTVEVAPTVERVRNDFLLQAGDEFLPCLKRLWENVAVSEGFQITHYSSRSFDVQVPQSEGDVGISLRIAIKAGTARFAMHLVAITAVVGHAEITVSGIAENRDAPSAATLTALLAKSVKRARAAV